MSDNTHIQWTDASWSPLRARRNDGQPNKGGGGWSCQRVSPGCEHCYAETINKRLGTGLNYDAKGVAESEHYLDERALTQPLRWRKGRRIFLSSMTDLFGDWVEDAWLDRIFAVMALTPQHVYQVLTKRPERMRAYVSRFGEQSNQDRLCPIADEFIDAGLRLPLIEGEQGHPCARAFPLENLWLGTSVEDQRRADERIPELLATPAAVRFISAEPLLGPVDLQAYLPCSTCGWDEADGTSPPLSWVIAGGESGPGARSCDISWIRSLVAQCQAAGTAVFCKQLGAKPSGDWGDPNHPFKAGWWRLGDRKGGAIEEFPADLRVREFPQ